MLKDRFYNDKAVGDGIEQFKKDILENKISGYKAAEILVNDYLVRWTVPRFRKTVWYKSV